MKVRVIAFFVLTLLMLTCSGCQTAQSQWYGDQYYPFSGIYEEGGWLEVEPAMEDVVKNYYSYCNWGGPDSSEYVLQESNYPQYCSAALPQYRWSWVPHSTFEHPVWAYTEGAAAKQPEAYQDVIVLEIAEMTWLFLESLHEAMPELSDEAYEALPLAEQVKLQSQWLKARQFDGSYYQITGLCIFNGDSRSKKAYQAGSRAKNIVITINDIYQKEVSLADTPEPQLIDVDYMQEYIDKPVKIQIEVVDAYEGNMEDIFITEIGVGISSDMVTRG